MRRTSAIAATLLLLVACGGSKHEASYQQLSKDPISVRGWIADIDTGKTGGMYRTVETEAARRQQNFQATNLWVENAPYVSGGVAENGAFVLLDVPPGTATISFSAPGIGTAHLTIENIPGNADVLVPGLILRTNAVGVADPHALQVRSAAHIDKARPTHQVARVAGVAVPVMEVPINTLVDRHDYPIPPGISVPVAKVR